MARKPKPQPLDANLLRPSPVDLFGEVPISRRELMLWLWKVPTWFSRHAPQAKIDGYLRGWAVADKIRREKLAGRLEAVFGDEDCPHCGALLEFDLEAHIASATQERKRASHRPALILVFPPRDSLATLEPPLAVPLRRTAL